MRSDKFVPDYIIYDELKRERERAIRDERPRLEVPRYMPMWPDEFPSEDEEADEGGEERGETVIRMW